MKTNAECFFISCPNQKANLIVQNKEIANNM